MLSTQDIKLVQSTIPLIEQAGSYVTEHFYQRMFKHNPETMDIFNLSNQHSGAQKFALFSVIVSYAKNLDNIKSLSHAVERIANKHVSMHIKAEDYQIVGHHLIETLRELLDEKFSPLIEQAWLSAYGVLAKLFIDREEEIYQTRESNIGGWRGKRAFALTDKIKESELVTSFVFSPIDQQPVMNYQAGQYLAIELKPESFQFNEIRQYSLSTKANGENYRISVKKETGERDGIVSHYLHDSFQVGDLVDLHAPSGDFYFVDRQNPVVLISAGVGITPMQAMLDTLASSNYQYPVTYLHACESAAQHSFKEHTAKVCMQHDWQNYTWYQNEESEESTTFTGNMFIELVSLPLAQGDFYLCGPVGFMKFIKDQLISLGVDEDRIHYEVFGPHATL